MIYRIEVMPAPGLPDRRGAALLKDIADLNLSGVNSARVVEVYWLKGNIDRAAAETIAREALTDPVTETFRIDEPGEKTTAGRAVLVAHNPGVTDPVEETILKAAADLGIALEAARTGRLYLLGGSFSRPTLDLVTNRLLLNPIVQHAVNEQSVIFGENPAYHFQLRQIDLPDGDAALCDVGKLFCLSPDEVRAAAEYYAKAGRKPTDVELETLAQSWSEHCVHKTFKARYDFDGQVIDNLLKTTIARATNQLDKDWCLSVFVDNSGVIDFDGENAVCFKVETHNHPSAVEPYGGAATGLGGVIRDVLGTGLAARPIFNTDVFCFGEPDMADEELPPGTLHPRRVFKGVRSGVADYGNRMGIPTVNGAVLFDNRYTGNPLVFCGTAGIMPAWAARPGRQSPGDLIVLMGGRTGRDGIHGVTFSSEELSDKSNEQSFSSVQIGNPIVEKRMTEAILKARDERLFTRITDVGGGGLSSAVGEMGESTGAKVYLDRVPLKYSGLSYAEIWISESQERMVLAVPPQNFDRLLEICRGEGVEATAIGEFTSDKKLKLYYDENLVCDLDMEFLHGGRPQLELRASYKAAAFPEPTFPCPARLDDDLLRLLSRWNTCAKEWVIRQYDHEVQGGSVLKPLVGHNSDGPGDAAVIRPVLDSGRGVIVACGINPAYSEIDTYRMAASAIDEAVRNTVAAGGSLGRLALLDNFCWGSVKDEQSLGALVRAAQACADLSLAYGTPFISGKDSLNNQFRVGDRVVSIPHTLLVSAIGIMPDAERAVTMDFKGEGNLIYLVGETKAELGGSAYYAAHGFIGNSAPAVAPAPAKASYQRLSAATARGLARACHDLSEGGLGVALAEMAFAGGLGARINLSRVPQPGDIIRDDYLLFSESNSRLLVEVAPADRADFELIMESSAFGLIGEVTSSPRLKVQGLNGSLVIDQPLTELKNAWQRPLKW
ncbi:phosphoribosylformylglycinamidine synthase subunit II [Dehalogenimonas alkenigignens]|uniref:Phosphoribosylformylglycinamidine synthase subunit PurL n=1 Tax=Dehalogenimonas alkenigignens TaxID=1217799 RepID=A0A0W0GI24_9CHLR|nr:phosphoribosylformylglycinamidine synthase subunit PurL [Dehalogenimonas alkenigignens]KTB48212.1 phosphoribosylformylglycinamidine synthase subunit II [Dehalogenimonas alkenigignens]